MQAEYVKRLKEAENSDSEQGSFKRLKSDNGNGMAVPDDVAAFSEEAADWLLLNPGEWAEKLVPCVRSSEYHWFKCETDAEYDGFIEVIGQIDSSTFLVENGSSVYHPSTCPVAEDVNAPVRDPGVPGVGRTKRGYYCVKAYHDCVRKYQDFLMRLQVTGDVEWRDDSSVKWQLASVSKRLRIIEMQNCGRTNVLRFLGRVRKDMTMLRTIRAGGWSWRIVGRNGGFVWRVLGS